MNFGYFVNIDKFGVRGVKEATIYKVVDWLSLAAYIGWFYIKFV